MSRKAAEFKFFKEEFAKYQRLFSLTGYAVYFLHEPLNCYADIETDQHDMIATVRLDSGPAGKFGKHVLDSAKHEAIHLLISRLDKLARSRYTTESEVDTATEELVRKLTILIPDILTPKSSD